MVKRRAIAALYFALAGRIVGDNSGSVNPREMACKRKTSGSRQIGSASLSLASKFAARPRFEPRLTLCLINAILLIGHANPVKIGKQLLRSH